MNQKNTVIQLFPWMFGRQENNLVSIGSMSATLFTFTTGICGIRIITPIGEVILLPFQGQQIWSAKFHGRELGMSSMVKMPVQSMDFLSNFGGFLVHCGATAVGGPSKEDTHPLHGELPNAAYGSADLVTGQDDQGPFIGIGGSYHHVAAFGQNYLAEPLVKVYQNTSRLRGNMVITNLKKTPMELFYLAHINFKPEDYSRLVYSAQCTPEHVRVRASIPAHIHPGKGYRELLESFISHPELHHELKPGMAYDPEVVFFIDYLTDPEGWAYSMQIHPDGTADFLQHKPSQLRKATRWISRTPDQDAIAIAEPGTAEPEGYLAEKAKGNTLILAPSGKFKCDLEFGLLQEPEVNPMVKKIQQIVG